jgi:hypothetical protein
MLTGNLQPEVSVILTVSCFCLLIRFRFITYYFCYTRSVIIVRVVVYYLLLLLYKGGYIIRVVITVVLLHLLQGGITLIILTFGGFEPEPFYLHCYLIKKSNDNYHYTIEADVNN